MIKERWRPLFSRPFPAVSKGCGCPSKVVSAVQLHGLPVPVDLEGDSWVPLLQQSNADSPGKPRIFSQYPHPLVAGASKHGFSNYSGYTM